VVALAQLASQQHADLVKLPPARHPSQPPLPLSVCFPPPAPSFFVLSARSAGAGSRAAARIRPLRWQPFVHSFEQNTDQEMAYDFEDIEPVDMGNIHERQ
jgi:hypothetical protein